MATRDDYVKPRGRGCESTLCRPVSPAILAKVDELFKLEPLHERGVIQTDMHVAHVRPLYEQEMDTIIHTRCRSSRRWRWP